MNLANTVLLTRTDFLANVRAFLGALTVTDAQIITALNMSLSAWGDKAKTAYCYDATWAGCECQYTLPCCGIDDADFFLKDCDGCEHRLQDYCIRKGVVHLGGMGRYASLYGLQNAVRIIAYAAPPMQPAASLTLSRAFSSTGTEIYLSADLGFIPFGGWVNLCGSWYQYRCWERKQVTRERIDTFESTGTVQTTIDPAVLRDVEACDIVTVLKMVKPHCTNTVAKQHTIGSSVELGISSMSETGLQFLVARTLSEVFTMLAMGCTSDDKSRFYLDMAKAQEERAMAAGKRSRSGRTPQVHSRGFGIQRQDQFSGGYEHGEHLRRYL